MSEHQPTGNGSVDSSTVRTPAQKAAQEYAKSVEYPPKFRDQDAFLAGAAWQREQDAKLCDAEAAECITGPGESMGRWCAKKIRGET